MKNVCKATGRGRVPANFVGERPYDIRLKLEAEFDKYYDMVVSLSRSKRLTIPAIKTMITGVGDEISFLKVGDAPEQLKGLIAMVKEILKSWGNPGKWFKKSWGNRENCLKAG